ncbi:MAG: cystathionine beta-synthase [Myxococcota bacterium]
MHRVYDSILDCIGDTPMVRLNRVTEGLKCTVYAKVEFFNPAGSIKDRIAKQIIEDAESEGMIAEGGMVVEGTSGNTGAGLALMSAVRGYTSTFVMADKQSEEKRQALRAWGSRVVICPTNVDADDPRSYYEVSKRIVQETPNSFYANQYHNPSNPKAHYLHTGPEIYNQLDGKIDVLIAGLGTGGTITGIGRYLKEQNPDIQIVGVDPVGSLYYDYFHTGKPTQPYSYLLEGIGEDFLPSTMDFQYVDDVVRVNDKECFLMTRRMVREEGIFCGASCGAAVAGALKYLRRHDRTDLNVVVILPDSGKNYLTKLFNDKWMEENGFLESDNNLGDVAGLLARRGARKLLSIAPGASLADAINVFKEHGISQLPLLDKDGQVIGVVAERTLLTRALEGGTMNIDVAELADVDYCTVEPQTEITVLTELFRRYRLAIVLGNHKPVDIITRIDLIDYISHVTNNRGVQS